MAIDHDYKQRMRRERNVLASLNRAVHGIGSDAPPADEPAADRDGDGPPASDKQIAFLTDLLGQGLIPEDKADAVRQQIAAGKVTVGRASRYIDRLLELRKSQPKQATRTPVPDVPAGRYAVDTDEGHLAFYKVDRPTEGKWAGRTFVTLVLGGGGRQRMPWKQSVAVLVKIAQDPQAAMERYGRELGQCGHCGRDLTNEESRARGIGPVCAGKMGWGS